jgi:uncharacterized membrane-anchored protein YitT (DUF2179 family)
MLNNGIWIAKSFLGFFRDLYQRLHRSRSKILMDRVIPMDLVNTGPIEGINSKGHYCRATRTTIGLHIGKIHTALRASKYDLLYIASGCIIFVIGMKALMIPHQLLGGGIAGFVLIFYYIEPGIDMGLLYFLLNLPLIWLGWNRFGRRFLALTVFGMIFFSIAAGWVNIPEIIFHDRMTATICAGIICGLGSGLILRSHGSAGGFDILAIVLNRKTRFSVANFSLAFNAMPLVAGVWFYDMDTILYSCLFHLACSRVIKVVMGYQSPKCVNGNPRLSLTVS